MGGGGKPHVVDFGLARMVGGARRGSTGWQRRRGMGCLCQGPCARSSARCPAWDGPQEIGVRPRSAPGSRGRRASAVGCRHADVSRPGTVGAGAGDTAVDIWALGVMMLRAAEREASVSMSRARAELRAQSSLEQTPPRLETRLDVHPELATAVDACLRRNPRLA